MSYEEKIICFTLLYIIYLSLPTYRSLSREAFIYQIPNLKFLQKFCTVILLIMFYRNITFDPVILTSETILLVVKPLDLTRVITIIVMEALSILCFINYALRQFPEFKIQYFS